MLQCPTSGCMKTAWLPANRGLSVPVPPSLPLSPLHPCDLWSCAQLGVESCLRCGFLCAFVCTAILQKYFKTSECVSGREGERERERGQVLRAAAAVAAGSRGSGWTHLHLVDTLTLLGADARIAPKNQACSLELTRVRARAAGQWRRVRADLMPRPPAR